MTDLTKGNELSIPAIDFAFLKYLSASMFPLILRSIQEESSLIRKKPFSRKIILFDTKMSTASWIAAEV
jgi:hypothetical protein